MRKLLIALAALSSMASLAAPPAHAACQLTWDCSAGAGKCRQVPICNSPLDIAPPPPPQFEPIPQPDHYADPYADGPASGDPHLSAEIPVQRDSVQLADGLPVSEGSAKNLGSRGLKMQQWTSDNWALVLTAAGSLGTAFVGLGAVIYAALQVNTSRQLNAEDAYIEFNKLGIQYPELAEGGKELINGNNRTKYYWFVVALMMAVERILRAFPRDREWRASVVDDLKQHSSIILAPDFPLSNFSPELRRLIQAVFHEE